MIMMIKDEHKEVTGHLAILENLSDQMYEMHVEILKKSIDFHTVRFIKRRRPT